MSAAGAAGVGVLAAFLCASCGVPRLRLPSGRGLPAPDAADAFEQATAACRRVSSITAEVGVTGSISGQRVRARLLVGLAAPASARLEAFAYSQQVFIFVARTNDATLLMTREGRVLEHGAAREVLEAITGVPLDAAGLRTALTGCPEGSAATQGRQLGEDWRLIADGSSDVYLRRAGRSAPWLLVASVHREGGGPPWRAEYRDFENGLPMSVRLASSDDRRFDLRLALSQVETNVALEPAAFAVKISPSTSRMTMEELRRSGPFSNAR